MRVHENGGYERLRVGTVQHAMVGMLREPPSGFEGPIRAHFRLKRDSILALVKGKWLEEATPTVLSLAPTPTVLSHIQASG